MMAEIVERVTACIEALAVLVIVVGIVFGSLRFFVHQWQKVDGAYKLYKNMIGRALLLGLEFLVAADIIETVSVAPTLQNIALLGILVLIRTFLSWSLVVEIEGHLPWRAQSGSE